MNEKVWKMVVLIKQASFQEKKIFHCLQLKKGVEHDSIQDHERN